MKKIGLQSALLFLCIIFIRCISRSASLSPKESLLGVGPEDETYYKGLSSLGTINCKNGFKKFNKSQLNDDFCDCLDGSDEPGTSACPNGKFYCRNAGHVPLFIYSSRVNDGICDCCDGSDEYDGNIKCPNTCWEAGKMARDRLKKKITTYEEGVTIRKRNVEQAKLAIAKEEAELSKLQGEQKILDELVQQLREHKEQIEKAEEKEQLQKVKEKKERKEAEEAEANDEGIEPVKNDINDKIGISSPPPQNSVEDNHDYVGKPEVSDHHTIIGGYPNHGIEQMKKDLLQNAKQNEAESFVDGKAGLETGSQEKDVAEDTKSLSREELGRLVASRWTGEKTELQTEEADASKDDNHPNPDEIPNDTRDEEYNGYDSEDDEDRYDDGESDNQVDDFAEGGHDFSDNPESDDESDLLDITSTSNPSWLEKIQKTVRSIMQAVNLFQTPVNTSEAAHVRKEYDASSAKLSKIQTRISSLEQKLKHDLGQEKEFYSFYDQCFETKQNKYVYKICPFKQATQVEGHSRTRLGSWEKFEDSYRIMQFSNGDKCWNGPDRSLKVKLRCGLKNEISDLDEPSRCEYLALLSTPALCLEDKLKELRDKLETMNKEQPHGHDEL